MRRIGIIGGGASGMAAAIAAARGTKETEVFILEHKDTLGKKILATGNGRCNLTNRHMTSNCFRSDDERIIPIVLQRFGYEKTLRFFDSLGLVIKSRGDYIYPRSDQAASVLELMKAEIRRLGISVYTGIHAESIWKKRNIYHIKAAERSFQADKVILACGGKASEKLGSDGSGYRLAKSMGHTLIPVVPALVQLKIKNHPFSKASGVRTEAKVTVLTDGQTLSSDTGELQITAYGISGIPVFQISRYAARGLYEKKRVTVCLDVLPEMTDQEAENFFVGRAAGREEMEAGEYLTGIFPAKLIPGLLSLAGIRLHTYVRKLSRQDLKKLVDVCKHTHLTVSDTNGYENAQVCAGGIHTAEVDPFTMESVCADGLYLTGELLDVDGICGGYNLQWAWATGVIAGESAIF